MANCEYSMRGADTVAIRYNGLELLYQVSDLPHLITYVECMNALHCKECFFVPLAVLRGAVELVERETSTDG